jgi:hypothetical protein
MKIESEILTTKSICSNVVDSAGEVAGHMVLLDYDDMEENQVKSRIDDVPGINIVLRSSEGSFHVWNLCVQSLEKTACRQVLLRDDTNHVRNGISSGRWRLRIGPKEYRNGEVYKSRPELVTVGLNPTDQPQSRPHMDVAKALWDIPEPPAALSFEWAGETAGTDQYATMTDKLKEWWREQEEKHG